MQLNLEAESRNKVEAMRVKKKLEQDITELEVTLDGVNKARAETERNFKKYQQQIRDLQQVHLYLYFVLVLGQWAVLELRFLVL